MFETLATPTIDELPRDENGFIIIPREYPDWYDAAQYNRERLGSLLGNKVNLGDAAQNVFDVTARHEDSFFILEGLPEDLPAYFTLRFVAPENYCEGDKLSANYLQWNVSTTDAPELSAPDLLFGKGALVSLEVDRDRGIAFFKPAGGGRWNIYYGEEPPDVSDGLFVETEVRPTHIAFSDTAPSLSGRWRRLRPSTYAIGYIAVTEAYNGMLYTMAGTHRNAGSQSRSNQMYNPVTDTWTILAQFPGTAPYVGGCCHNGLFYVSGGNAASQPIYIYNPASNTWTTGPSIGVRRYGPACTGLGSSIYFICGGSDYDNPLSTVMVYNITTKTFSSGTAFPNSGPYKGAITYNGKMYCVDGQGIRSSTGGAWTMELSATGLASYTIGSLGIMGTKLIGANFIYDFATKKITPFSPIRSGGTVIGQTYYSIGGVGTNLCEAMAIDLTGCQYLEGGVIIQYYGVDRNRTRLRRDSGSEIIMTVQRVYQIIDGEIKAMPSKTNIDGLGWQSV